MSSFDYHINSREIRAETGKIKDDFRLALESLAETNSFAGLEQALAKLSTNPLTQRERAQKAVLDCLLNLKLPYCTLEEYKVRYLQYQNEQIEQENRRKHEAEAEILRQNAEQIARGVQGTVYQIPPGPDGLGGGLAGVGAPFHPPLLHPTLAVVDRNLPRFGADPWTTSKSITRGIDFHTLQPLPRPLQFVYEIELSYWENDIVWIPALDTIDIQKTIIRCVRRAEELGCDRKQVMEFFLKLLKKYYSSMYYALHSIEEYERFCTEFSKMVSVHDYSAKIEASLAKVQRKPDETIQAVALRWRDLQALKFKYKMPHLSPAEQERKAKNSVLEDLGMFMSDSGAALYKQWLNHKRKEGDRPDWDQSLEHVNTIEENSKNRLTTTKTMDASVLKKVQAYSTTARQYAGEAGAAGVGGKVSSWSSPGSPMYSGRNSPARDRRSSTSRSPNRADINSTRYESPSPGRGDRYYRNYPSSGRSGGSRSPGRQSGRSGRSDRSPGGRGGDRRDDRRGGGRRDNQRDGRGGGRDRSEERRRERYDLRDKIEDRRRSRQSPSRSGYRSDNRSGRDTSSRDNQRGRSSDRYGDNRNRDRDKSGRFLSRSPSNRSNSRSDGRSSGRGSGRDKRGSSARGRTPSKDRKGSRPGSRDSSQPRRSQDRSPGRQASSSNRERRGSWERSPIRKGRELENAWDKFQKQANPRLGDKRNQKN